VKGGSAGLNFQPITLEIVRHFGKNGGNPLGLHGEDEPLMSQTPSLNLQGAFLTLVVMGLVVRWSKVEDDAVMHEFGERVLERAVNEAKRMGLHHPYIYQNYAGASQDVFAGYGLENRLRLMEIQKRYDPEGVFHRLQPGGFKVQVAQEYSDFEE
jgi:hypothetical protein